MKGNKLHYYLFSFVAGDNTYARVTIGWHTKNVTESRISEARDAAMGGYRRYDACPLAVSYLGLMTRDEMTS